MQDDIEELKAKMAELQEAAKQFKDSLAKADVESLRNTPDTFGVPLPVLNNIGPLVAGLGGSSRFVAAVTVVAVAMNSAWECLKADLNQSRPPGGE